MPFIRLFKEKNTSELFVPQDMDNWELRNDFAIQKKLRLETYATIVLVVILFAASFYFFPDALFSKLRQFNEQWSVFALPISMLLYIIVHELTHVLVMPRNVDSVGQRYCLVSNGMPAAFYNGGMTLNRFITMALSPLVTLSLVFGVLLYFYDDALLEFLLLNHIFACLMDIKIAIRSWKYKREYSEVYSSREGVLFKK